MLEVGSLFSGVGGFELGLERTGGFKTIWYVENEPYAKAVLKKQWPATTVYDDITTINFRDLPRVDVLTGGFPCQDISNAGKRAGITGSRSSLWANFARAIRTLRPRYALIENVSALTSRGIDVVLSDLAALRYDAEWHCFPASAVGAPHRRDRILILAYPCDDTDRKEVGGESSEEGADASTFRKKECWSRESSGAGDMDREAGATYLHDTHSDVADSNSEGLQGLRCAERDEKERSECCSEGNSRRGWWAAEPCVGRVADGIPNRTHRIKCLGNAVVPAWAEAVGRTIMKIEYGFSEVKRCE